MAKWKIEWTVGHYFRAEVEAGTLEEAVALWLSGETIERPVEFGAEVLDDYTIEEV